MAEWKQMGGRTGTQVTHCGTSSSMRESVRGPMADYMSGSSNGRPVICQHPMSKNLTHQQCEET
ncbi:unnamed protein product [Staurois parvus]|uniref:Uncharacterized protein n=1 Tax=Staurois parvus TaxID=386267 RepID=A0ABN9HHP1_9NEOB|nr:unnamed protein product [Staurois parvus]